MEPKIRLKGFSGEWKKFCIEDTATLKAGKTFNFARDYDKILPCYGGNGIRGYVDVASHKGLFPIIGRQGALCGNVILAEGEFYATEHAVVVTPKNGNNAVFLYYDYIVANLNQYATGCAQPGLSVDNINKVGICVPSLPEQTAIANYFSNLDTLIQSTAKKLDKLRTVKAASLQSLFPQEGEMVPRVRFKGFSGEWKRVKLSSFAKRVTRKNTNLESSLALTIASAYGLVSQFEYFNNLVVGANIKNYYLLKKGEFAYNKSYSNGYPFGSVKRLDRYDMGILSTLYIVFSINKSVNSDYLTQFFNTNLWHKEVADRAEEGARNHGLLNIGAESFLDIDIFLPNEIDEQKKIAFYLQSLDTQISLEEKRLEKLRNIKAACLDNMFV